MSPNCYVQVAPATHSQESSRVWLCSSIEFRSHSANASACITTTLRIADARNGATVHWAQDRPISIMEARRAQNYPDYEPIIGTLTQQYEIVGNGVDRMVSLAFGLALSRALAKNPVNPATQNAANSSEWYMQTAETCNIEDGYLTDVTDSINHIDLKKDELHEQESGSIARLNSDVESSSTVDSEQCWHIQKQVEPTLYEQLKRKTGTTLKRENTSVSTTRSLCLSKSTLFLSKRQRKHDNIKGDGEHKVARVDHTSPNKRTKIVFCTRSSSVLTDKSASSPRQLASQSHTRATSLSSTSTRPTRRSGHTIEFTSINWNKRPESRSR